MTNPANARLNLSYVYQNNGNVSQMVDATRSETLNYTYDELDRLDIVSGAYTQNYDYNPIGNLTSKDSAANPGTNGLVAWWRLNETSGTRDDSHSVNDLTDNNTVGSGIGKKGNAADFEKDNSEYLSRASSAALQMGASDIYVGAWIKAENTLVSYPQIISKTGGNREFHLRVNSAGTVEFLVYDTTGANYSLASSTTNISLGQWYYVEGWTDKANRTAYVNVNNGTPGSATWTAGENRDGANTMPLIVGARESNGVGEFWDGLIDEAVYYKRTLSAGERAWLYNNGNGRAYADLSSGSPTAYTYNATHKHAVTALSTGETYTYDANGNMITRVEGGLTYTQTFDAENRLISVTVSGQTTQFIYDGDGNLVKKIKPDGSKTIYVGGIYEVDKTSGGSVTRTVTYYPAGGAMRINSTLYYILKDHLGSASVITDSSGNILGENRYYPFGETRLTTGSILTDKLYTGQREITGLGIYDYKARYYSAKLGRFLSPDSIVPSYANPQSLNRFSYVANNPLRYTDPTGHYCIDEDADGHIIRVDCDSGEPPSPSPANPPGGGGGGGGGGETDPVVELLQNISTTLDIIAWTIDLYNAGVVTYGGIFGAGIPLPFALGGPEIPVVTGLAGIGIAELSVQPSLQLANYLALGSTILTAVADIRSGDTNIDQGVIAPTTLNSITTTIYGFGIPEAYSSLVIQSVTVANDLGWTSFPFPDGSK